MCFHSFSGSRELPVMHEGAALVVETPELAGDELAVAIEESWRPSRLILVERFAFGIGCRVTRSADVVQLEIGVGGDHDHAAFVGTQARLRQLVTG